MVGQWSTNTVPNLAKFCQSQFSRTDSLTLPLMLLNKSEWWWLVGWGGDGDGDGGWGVGGGGGGGVGYDAKH